MDEGASPLLLVEALVKSGDCCEALTLGLCLGKEHLLVLNLLLLEQPLLLFQFMLFDTFSVCRLLQIRRIGTES